MQQEAVSDARKRALRVFGNALGNSVYDRDYIQTVHVPQKVSFLLGGSINDKGF